MWGAQITLDSSLFDDATFAGTVFTDPVNWRRGTVSDEVGHAFALTPTNQGFIMRRDAGRSKTLTFPYDLGSFDVLYYTR